MTQMQPGRFSPDQRGDLRLHVPNAERRKLPDIADLADRLRFSTSDGRIWLGDRRMVLIHATAQTALRRELIESLGIDRARGLLMRMGYLAGSQDAQFARQARPAGDFFDAFSVGPQLHALEGVVLVEPVRMEYDPNSQHYYGEFIWRDSSEDEGHIGLYGIGNEPVCWSQIGYASGFTSTFLGRLVLFREVECRAMGQPYCRIVGKPVEEWDDPGEDLRCLQVTSLLGSDPKSASAPPRRPARGRTRNGPRGSERPAPETSAATAATDAIGISAGFNAACHLINRVAPTRATVLLIGESGVGKEVFARMLHRISPRADGPFVAVNCAAIPEQLVESELFGAEKGAFTGASQSRPGHFECAHGGTLFLDEICALGYVAQGKLLRVLQEKEVQRVGDTRSRKVDVRVVAATNSDLRERVKAGLFREDLFYRLNVFPVHIPPLRERREDIPLLMNYFLEKFCTLHGKPIAVFSARSIEALLNYDWPGNIRELENTIERAIILTGDGEMIEPRHLAIHPEKPAHNAHGIAADGCLTRLAPRAEGADGGSGGHDGEALAGDLRALLRSAIGQKGLSMEGLTDECVRTAVEIAKGNLSLAARLLGLTRAQVAYRMNRMGSADAVHKSEAG